MSEPSEHPIAKFWNIQQESPVFYANNHLVTHTNKEIQIILGTHALPDEKIAIKARILLTERHALELIHNLQHHVNAFIKEHKDKLDDDPPKRN